MRRGAMGSVHEEEGKNENTTGREPAADETSIRQITHRPLRERVTMHSA
jgi:hypothetical protein